MYISASTIKNFIGGDCSLDDAMNLVDISEGIFNSLIGSDGLEYWEKIEYFDSKDVLPCKSGVVFFLKNYNPIDIVSVNDDEDYTININYVLDGRRLHLKDKVNFPVDFPYKTKIVYNAGLDKIPQEVTSACLFIAKAVYSSGKYGDMDSFRQDLLAVNFKETWQIEKIVSWEDSNFINLIVNKYRVTFFHVI